MKCAFLSLILGVIASAGTATRIETTYGLAQVGQRTLIYASVFDAATGRHISEGTMAFSADGVAIPGCEAAWVFRVNGSAVCEAVFPKVAIYRIVAAYSGTSQYDASSAEFPLPVGKMAPSVYIASDPIRPTYGATTIVNALVLGATGMPHPTGTVTFFDNGQEVVTRPVRSSDDRATLGLPLSAGQHHLEAVYNGDDLYQPTRRGDPALDLTITKGPSVVAISSTPAQIKQPVTITASVMPNGAGGTITFEGVPGCVDVPVLDSHASCAATFTQLGPVNLAAKYSGDSNLTPGSASMKLNVGRVVAGIYVACDPKQPVYGQTVTVGALAMGAQGIAGPTGIIVFSDSLGGTGAGALDGGGHTQWLSTFPAGFHTFLATYNGDANYGTSQGSGTCLIGKASTKTTLAAAAGTPLTVTVAAVAPGSGSPTGSVRFTRDGVAIGMAPLARSGTASVATLTANETGTLGAEYLGDLNFTGSFSAPAFVAAPRVELNITADRNPAPAGKVTFTVIATPNAAATPSGSVQVTVDGAPAGGGALAGGAVTVSVELKPGTHAVVAAYAGDPYYPAASASMQQIVTAPLGTLALTANPQAPVYGEPITFTAQLPSGSSGTVQFADGATPLGTTAGTLTVSRLSAGLHGITASWPGDAHWAANSAQLALTVAKAQTAVALSASNGQAAVQVTAVAPGSGTPTGMVRFLDAVTRTLFAAGALDKGMTSTVVPTGLSNVVAEYSGDANFEAGVSAPWSVLTMVNAASYMPGILAPEEIVTLFGPNLAGALSATIADSTGVVRGADLLYAVEGQAALVVPAGVMAGPASLTVAGMTAALTIGRTAPGIFTADASGRGAPAGQSLRVRADGSQETGAADVIDLGENGDSVYLILYGTGIRLARNVACAVAGRAAQVVFAGHQGGAPGLDQVNVLLPPELKGAGAVQVIVSADGVAGNAVSIVLR